MVNERWVSAWESSFFYFLSSLLSRFLSFQLGLVVGYSVHLDAFAGRTARVHQLQPVLEDAAITVIELESFYWSYY
jgi:hypothetical protein